jgi:choline-glycine betaine transporter
MFIGGLKVMQVLVLVVSLPILIIGVVMCLALVRSLRDDVR